MLRHVTVYPTDVSGVERVRSCACVDESNASRLPAQAEPYDEDTVSLSDVRAIEIAENIDVDRLCAAKVSDCF